MRVCFSRIATTICLFSSLGVSQIPSIPNQAGGIKLNISTSFSTPQRNAIKNAFGVVLQQNLPSATNTKPVYRLVNNAAAPNYVATATFKYVNSVSPMACYSPNSPWACATTFVSDANGDGVKNDPMVTVYAQVWHDGFVTNIPLVNASAPSKAPNRFQNLMILSVFRILTGEGQMSPQEFVDHPSYANTGGGYNSNNNEALRLPIAFVNAAIGYGETYYQNGVIPILEFAKCNSSGSVEGTFWLKNDLATAQLINLVLSDPSVYLQSAQFVFSPVARNLPSDYPVGTDFYFIGHRVSVPGCYTAPINLWPSDFYSNLGTTGSLGGPEFSPFLDMGYQLSMVYAQSTPQYDALFNSYGTSCFNGLGHAIDMQNGGY